MMEKAAYRTPEGKTLQDLDEAEDAARAAADCRPAGACYDGDEEEEEEEEEEQTTGEKRQ